jgi:hypothetical protein
LTVESFWTIFDGALLGQAKLMGSQKVVTPVKTGVQVFPKSLEILDSGFRRNDGKGAFSTFYEFIKIQLAECRGQRSLIPERKG